MQWVIVIIACLIIGGWLLRVFTFYMGADGQVVEKNYMGWLILFAVIAFFALALLGSVVGR